MTLAAEVLDTYARDWQIDETPVVPESVAPSLQRHCSADVWCSSLFSLIATYAAGVGISVDQLLGLNAVPTTPSGVLRFAVRAPGLEALYGWTTATMEISARVSRLLENATRDVERRLHSQSQVSEQLETRDPSRNNDDSAANRGMVSARNTAHNDLRTMSNDGRARRAIEAVRDLARWLGTTDARAAELAGGYRRSYYNWLRGTRPYPATTLNLFEAHAFVAALVDAIGERGARSWLGQTGAGGDRRAMLGTEVGRNHLSAAASSILFRPQVAPVWNPDDDAEHEAAGRADPAMFGPALAPPPPPWDT